MPKPKRGKLRDIKTNEVSVVDKPANKLPFVFFKREDGQGVDLLKKKKKIKIEIESDGLVGGTTVVVNGEKLGKLRSFDFSFWGDDPKQQIHASYSKVAESDDGFSRTENFYLSKGEIVMSKEMLKALQEYLGTEEIDFEKKVDEEKIQETIELITKHYKESFPQDLEDAVGILAKRAASSYEVEKKEDLEKAGAKFSKDVVKKLQAIITAVKALEGMLPEMKQSTEKAESGKSEETAELAKQITELKEAIAKLDPDKKDDNGKTDIAELTKSLKDVSERLKTMEKSTDKSKRLDDQDDDDKSVAKGAGENGEVLWKSLQTEEERQE